MKYINEVKNLGSDCFAPPQSLHDVFLVQEKDCHFTVAVFFDSYMLRGLCFTDNADFGVEHDAVLLVDALLDFVDEAANVGGGGVAGGVDDEAGVLSRDLGAADLEALEAGFLD